MSAPDGDGAPISVRRRGDAEEVDYLRSLTWGTCGMTKPDQGPEVVDYGVVVGPPGKMT